MSWLMVVKRSAIWDSGVAVTCIWITIDFLGFKVLLESLSALVSKFWSYSMHLTQTGLQLRNGCRAKQSEIWDLERGPSYYVYDGIHV